MEEGKKKKTEAMPRCQSLRSLLEPPAPYYGQLLLTAYRCSFRSQAHLPHTLFQGHVSQREQTVPLATKSNRFIWRSQDVWGHEKRN